MAEESRTVEPNRILVLEDDENLIELYSEALSLSGYQVDGATTIPMARDLLDKQEYAVFLCDVYIGAERAIDLLGDLQSKLNNMFVIMLSGEGRYQETSHEIGADFFLAKPISVIDLVALVERLAPHNTPDV